MVDGGMISGAIVSLRTMKDMVTALVELRDYEQRRSAAFDVNNKLIDLQGTVMEVQQENATLLQTVSDLKAELARVSDWNVQKAKYELKAQGKVLVYAMKESVGSIEPPHSICPKCYQDSKKSILQPEKLFPGGADVLVCHVCDSDFYVTGQPHLDHPRRTKRRK